MEFTQQARAQAEAMVDGLLGGEGALFRIDLDDEAALQELLLMLLIGAEAQQMAPGLAVAFFIAEPESLGIEVSDDSLALLGPGITRVDEVAEDLAAATNGSRLSGCLLVDDEMIHAIAKRFGAPDVVSYALSGSTVHRTSLDPDTPLMEALVEGLDKHGA